MTSGPADPIEELLAYCEREREWVTAFIESLATIESPSSDKTAVDRLGAFTADRFDTLGWRTESLTQPTMGDHLRLTWGSRDTQVLLLGHIDTVWPIGQLARMPVRHDESRLCGPGVFDMKGGIGVGALAVRALAALGLTPRHRVVWLLTSDEEVGSQSSRALIEDEARRSVAVLVLEPSLPGGGVKTARKGVGEFTIEVQGVSAHAGIEPEKGVNAIVELAHQVLALQRLQDPSRGLTITAGRVEGGTRTNVVPAYGRLELDVRVSTMADARAIEQALYALTPHMPGAALRVSGGINRPPLERSADVVRLYESARTVALALNRDLAEGATGGGSDGNFTAALGVPTLDGLGPLGGGAHALDEHVEVDHLPWRAALIAGLLMRL
jgi:glutamate carboxypeptidase